MLLQDQKSTIMSLLLDMNLMVRSSVEKLWRKPEVTRKTYRASPAVRPSSKYMAAHSSIPIPAYFWGEDEYKKIAYCLPRAAGNVEAGQLMGDGGFERVGALVEEALNTLAHIYRSVDPQSDSTKIGVVDLLLSEDLQTWAQEQREAGRVLPGKGFGLGQATREVVKLVGAGDWPAPLLTNNTMFGAGWANMCIGAYDAQTLYSNYCCDIAFYYEHGFDKVFPDFEPAFRQAGYDDRHALSTFAGQERRMACLLGVRYIRSKISLETSYLPYLTGKSARLDRRTAQVLNFSESSLIGLAVEAIVRGFDPAAVMADMVYSSPATDVIDVGSDLGNSELMNSFLNTADITDSGIVAEDALRKVYDAYSHTCARMLTERWATPTAVMNAQQYVWHILNDRHFFLRRIVLGYTKVRKAVPNQREGDMDEVFDERLHTTGFSRELKNACNGQDTCNQAAQIIKGHPSHELLDQLWMHLVIGPLEYARAGLVNEQREAELCMHLSNTMAQCWHDGLVYETNWLLCHASHHAWQVNFLMEAAMFGSFLDDGSLKGKLDRAD